MILIKSLPGGVSSAVYQMEGDYNLHLKGKPIWDVFVKRKNKIFQNQHAEIACDFYSRYSKWDLLNKCNLP